MSELVKEANRWHALALEMGHYVTQMLRGKLRIGARKVADA